MAGTWIDGLEAEARRVLPPAVFAYLASGARDGLAAAEAPAAWQRHRFRQRTLTGGVEPDPSTTLLGRRYAAPCAVAPTTLQRALHPDGELAMARACREADALLVVSSNASVPFADLGATGVSWWVQAYLPHDRELALPMLEAAKEAGAAAVVLTVDTPVVGTKYGDAARVWDHVPPRWLRVNLGDAAEAPKARDLGPADIGWLRERTGLPVVVKGVQRPEDAARAMEAGAGAVWVSTHGGRQLDRAQPTAELLPDIATEVGDRAEVYVDGGLRSGRDLVTTGALGAAAGFVGRPALWALAVGGEDGIRRFFDDMRADLAEALVLLGVARTEDAAGLLGPGNAR